MSETDVESFMSVTNQSEEDARDFLTIANGNLQRAIETYFDEGSAALERFRKKKRLQEEKLVSPHSQARQEQLEKLLGKGSQIRLTSEEIESQEKKRIQLKEEAKKRFDQSLDSTPLPLPTQDWEGSLIASISGKKPKTDATKGTKPRIECYLSFFSDGIVVNDDESFLPSHSKFYQNVLTDIQKGFLPSCLLPLSLTSTTHSTDSSQQSSHHISASTSSAFSSSSSSPSSSFHSSSSSSSSSPSSTSELPFNLDVIMFDRRTEKSPANIPLLQIPEADYSP
ncbi:putative UBA-like domain containing protein [Monocercomonoides exilis]|uniref:putative UBA-like domain containing protein n=1 Tax=Monocercomonoides exilis TaxID=2049356 RepID=UPI00355A47E7|nr:putative UBA-like domain containing protein [Monocercomonoides exilis]|eukprot:MONOS_10722.1-p1 / transcript=MONOS_10722.1 / gene=MONOS_10722 / organism=Monocercomonoides_exilis_PA203 / gene_product=UBA-like domain containing protein / transcript_product=UBA-like domain containing protein / location=Mono_scaffold00498:15548-16912(+) / protein_length=282 / sequence_SO=supercontig / SO=protein_coding / is_pseudo=false